MAQWKTRGLIRPKCRRPQKGRRTSQKARSRESDDATSRWDRGSSRPTPTSPTNRVARLVRSTRPIGAERPQGMTVTSRPPRCNGSSGADLRALMTLASKQDAQCRPPTWRSLVYVTSIKLASLERQKSEKWPYDGHSEPPNNGRTHWKKRWLGYVSS